MARQTLFALRALAVVAFLASGAVAWTGSTIRLTSSGAAGRAPVMVLTPSHASSASKLPVLLLLHSRCQTALGVDTDFRFANLVDTVRIATRRSARTALQLCAAQHASQATTSPRARGMP